MNRPIAIAVAVAVLAAVVAGAIVLSTPLRRSEEHLREALLTETPLGAEFDEVRLLLNARGWLDDRHHEHIGFLKQVPGRKTEVVGLRSLRAHLGHYRAPYRTDVTAFWGFDEEGKLVDIWVWKTTDSI